MGAFVEDKTSAAAKNQSKVLSETKSSKITRKTRDKKQLKGLDINAVIDAVENTPPPNDDHLEGKDKKPQGIIIDGRTYTCATCKTGHRVGICKHARERPMTATHPPGRPSAGAPKKVICDCPKQCKCKKKDCKCARNCSCTQSMYMLVYIPAPGETENAEEERGTWKIDRPVTTDLKGNILTQEQVKERQEQKEAQKTRTPDTRSSSITASTSPKAEPKPKEKGGCCKHKENVASKNIAAEASPQSGKVSKSASDGCNCGHTCDCAFCPQHPNNSTSINMARQQAMHFANQPQNNHPHSIVPFMPTMPQDPSCMGGLPRFAISRFSQMPSYGDLQRTFPNPGYVIGYPIWSTRTNSEGYSMAPFPLQAEFMSNLNTMNSGGVMDGLHQPLPGLEPDLPLLDFSQDEFGIGDAFVASAGPGGWDTGLVSPDIWPVEHANGNTIAENSMATTDYLAEPIGHPDPTMTPITSDATFDFNHNMSAEDDNSLFNFRGLTTVPMSELVSHQPQHRSCCANDQTPNLGDEVRGLQQRPFSPIKENASPVVMQSQG